MLYENEFVGKTEPLNLLRQDLVRQKNYSHYRGRACGVSIPSSCLHLSACPENKLDNGALLLNGVPTVGVYRIYLELLLDRRLVSLAPCHGFHP